MASRIRFLGVCWALSALVLIACDSDGGGDVCQQGVDALYSACNLCVTDEQGGCMSEQQALQACREDEDGPAVARCFTNVQDCDEGAFGQCLQNAAQGNGG